MLPNRCQLDRRDRSEDDARELDDAGGDRGREQSQASGEDQQEALAAARGGSSRPRRPGETGVVGEDPPLQLLGGRGRLEAELVDEHAPRVLVRLQRIRLAAFAIERQHEQSSRALAERLLAYEAFQLIESETPCLPRPEAKWRKSAATESRPRSRSERLPWSWPARAASGPATAGQCFASTQKRSESTGRSPRRRPSDRPRRMPEHSGALARCRAPRSSNDSIRVTLISSTLSPSGRRSGATINSTLARERSGSATPAWE